MSFRKPLHRIKYLRFYFHFLFLYSQKISEMKNIIIIILCFFTISPMLAQTSAIGGQGGLTIGWQRWNGQSRQPIFQYNGGLVYEKINSEKSSYLMSLGYHVRGSAIRSTVTNPNNGNLLQFVSRDKLHNLSLILGAKNRINTNFKNADAYYMFGVRGDMNLVDSLQTAFNYSQFVNRFTYGIMLGGGMQFDLGEKARFYLELQINPDFSNQIYAPPFRTFRSFNGIVQEVILPEQRVINVSMELIVGFKLLRY